MFSRITLLILTCFLSAGWSWDGGWDAGDIPGSAIKLNVDNFNGNLSSSDTDVQTAFETFDAFTVPPGYTDHQAQSATGWTKTDDNVYLTVSTNNVGIGTQSPSNKLTVIGNADITGNVGIGTSNPQNSMSIQTYTDGLGINFLGSSIGGCNVNTALLSHFNGSDSSTTFIDENCNGLGSKTLTAGGNAKLKTDVKKFGLSSVYFDGSGDYVSATSSTDYNFGAGDFTIAMWIRPSTIPSTGYQDVIISRGGLSGWYLAFQNNGTEMYWVARDNNPTGNIFTHGMSVGNWYHIAIVCHSGETKIYINGVRKLTTSSIVRDVNTPIMIGNFGYQPSNYGFHGYIDELVITKEAMYLDEFYVPEYPYGFREASPQVILSSNNVQTGKIWIDGGDADKFKIDVPSTTRMVIDVNGNTGMGITTPMNKLDVYGGTVIGTTYAGSIIAPTSGLLVSGNVGIGTAITRAKLDVEGTAYIKGNVGIGTITTKSTLDVNGSVGFSVVSTATNLALTNAHNTVVVTDTATITLPTAVGITGRKYNIINSGSGTVTIATMGGQTIRGEASLEMYDQGSVVLISNGANWERGS